MSDVIDRLNAALEDRYRIERSLGEGGMATVYLAEDLRHHRNVALKVLRPELAAVVGAQRFLAEIETTAKLQHPHVLPLFDSGEADGFLFYVMPWVEGESLRDRLRHEHQLPLDEAVALASKIAAALHYAHEQGVVHRDVKPANILLSRGEPLVADFGIALALSEAGEGRITETGLSMGTPHYMSPEQAAGERTLDKRSDVYALGCVLYEMLTGQPPYGGPTAQAVLGQILTADPVPPSTHRKAIPTHVDHAVVKALEKLPADRFDSAADFAAALRDRSFRRGVGDAAAGPLEHPTVGWKRVALGALAIAAILAGVQTWTLARGGGADREIRRQRIDLGSGILTADLLVDDGLALPPDGSGILFADTVGAGEGAQVTYWWKAAGDADAVRVPNMDGARRPVFSPDGQWVAYVVGRELRKQTLQGGGTVPLADDVDAAGALALAWLDDGTIVFENAGPIIERIAEDGGPRDTVADLALVGYPIHLSGGPGGGLLVTSCTDATCSAYRLYVIDLERDTVAMLTDGVLRAWSAQGDQIIYLNRQGVVFAARLDRGALRLGPPVPLFDGVATTGSIPARGQMAVGKDGTLLYARGQPAGGLGSRVVWVDRDGTVAPVDSAWGNDDIVDPALSPRGDRLAVSVGGQIWVKELPDGPLSQITVDEVPANRPTWIEDGRSLAYISGGAGLNHARSVRADGSSSAPDTFLIRERPVFQVLAPDDSGRVVFRAGTGGGMDVGYVEQNGDTSTTWLLDSEFSERAVDLSPDGRWLAYVSDRSGRDEVYVRPFPEAGARRIPISIDGGSEPRWAPSGPELFYVDGDQWLTAATVQFEPTFAVTSRTRLFDARAYRRFPNFRGYSLSPDGRRFVMLRAAEAEETPQADLVLVQNWFEEVRRAVGR